MQVVQAGRAREAIRHLHQFRLDWDAVSRKMRQITVTLQCFPPQVLRRTPGRGVSVCQYAGQLHAYTNFLAGTSTASAAAVAGVGCEQC